MVSVVCEVPGFTMKGPGALQPYFFPWKVAGKTLDLVYVKLLFNNNCYHLGTFPRHFIQTISCDIG